MKSLTLAQALSPQRPSTVAVPSAPGSGGTMKTLAQLLMENAPHYAVGGTVGIAPDATALGPPAPAPQESFWQRWMDSIAAGRQAQQATPTEISADNRIAGTQAFGDAPNQIQTAAQVPTSSLGFQQGRYTGTVDNSQRTLNGLAQALQAQAAGQGPSVAQSQLNSAADQNAARAAGAIASQRGLNPALAARLIAEGQASANQSAAGQSAQLRAQEQVNAQHELGTVGLGQLGTAGRLLTDNDKMLLEQNQGNQNAAINAQGQNLQATLANQASANHATDQHQQVVGGLIQAGGGLLTQVPAMIKSGEQAAGSGQPASSQTVQDPGTTQAPQPISDNGSSSQTTTSAPETDVTPPTPLAHGGLVHALRMAAGGAVPTYDYTGASQVGDPHVAISPGGVSAGGTLSGTMPVAGGAKASDKIPGWAQTLGNAVPIVGPLGMALGNAINDNKSTLNDWGNQFDSWLGLTPSKPAGPDGLYHAQGGPIPGHPKVKGDSLKNDTVPAMLSPGEIVLPRSVTQSEHAPDLAKSFVQAIKKAKGGEVAPRSFAEAIRKTQGRPGPTSYGEVLQTLNHLRAQLAALKGKG